MWFVTGAGPGRCLEKTLWQNGLDLISGLEQISRSEHMDPRKHAWEVRGQLSIGGLEPPLPSVGF